MACSSAPHSQAAGEAISHSYKQDRKRPTPVRRRLSRTQALLGRVISKGWVPVSGMKVQSLVGLSAHSTLHWWSAQCAARVLLSDKLMRRVRMVVSIWGAVHLHSMYRWALIGAGVQASKQGVLETVLFHCNEAQQVGCLREWEGCLLWCRTQAYSHNLQGVISRVSKTGVSTAALDRSRVFCGWIDQGKGGYSQPCCSSTPTGTSKPSQERDTRSYCESASCEVTQGVGYTWAICPTLFRGIWSRGRMAGFRCCSWLFSSTEQSVEIKQTGLWHKRQE